METTPNMNPESNQENITPPAPAPEEKSSWGSAIGIILIIAIIIIGGLYFWGQKIDERLSEFEAGDVTVEDILNAPDSQLEALSEEQSTSTDITDIEEDLDTTDLDNLDAELKAIEAELGV
jgi:uncharacterized protein HemX